MKALHVTSHAESADKIKLDLIEKPTPTLDKKNNCLIKVYASGVNPSDALAATGYFHHATLPRIPGRDFAGIIIEGPCHLKNKPVWGTGGAAGISFDGVQAEYIKLSEDEISVCPSSLDLITAGAQPLPYVTAYYSLVTRANIKETETVLVVGALGHVGRAAMSICQWKNCKPIALVRSNSDLKKAKELNWLAISAEDNNLAEKILAANNNQPINAILNSVGNIYWEDYIKILSEFGRIITIGARDNVRDVNINLFNLYRANQDLIGINSVALDFKASAKLLDEIAAGFEANKLSPLAVDPNMTYSPENASEAYKEVMLGKTGKKPVIKFD